VTKKEEFALKVDDKEIPIALEDVEVKRQQFYVPVPFPSKRRNPPATELQMEYRRQLVSEYTLAGLSPTQIRQKLDELAADNPGWEFLSVSKRTIEMDRQELLRRVQVQQMENMDTMRALWSERINRALSSIWPRILQGDLWAIDRFEKLAYLEMKVWNMDQPTQIGDIGDAKTQVLLERMVITMRQKGYDISETINQLIAGLAGHEAQQQIDAHATDVIEAEMVDEP
jgi:hypothetical protein